MTNQGEFKPFCSRKPKSSGSEIGLGNLKSSLSMARQGVFQSSRTKLSFKSRRSMKRQGYFFPSYSMTRQGVLNQEAVRKDRETFYSSCRMTRQGELSQVTV